MKTDKIDLSKLAKILGKLGSDSDHEVQVAIKQALAMLKAGKCNWQDVLKEAKPKPRKKATDTALGRGIVEAENVLEMFAQDWSKVMAGEQKNAKLLYLAATQRKPRIGASADHRAARRPFIQLWRNVKRSAAYHGLSVYSRGDFNRARASRREPSELLSGDYAGGLTRGPNLMAAQAAAASAPMASASIWGQHRDTNLADMFATRAKSSPTRERARESSGSPFQPFLATRYLASEPQRMMKATW
ncbi:MAG: hypothetical protein WBW37_12640 [Methyloceanibacter sp.]